MNFFIKKTRSFIGRNFHNISGWSTQKKIVVIESDDWGSIRMPSKQVYEICLKKGYKLSDRPFERYDTLANEDDLVCLFENLKKIKDSQGNHPIITANTVVANPDFEKIEKSKFQEYYYEPFTVTLKRYANHSRSFNLWEEGIKEKLFHPAFHAREHYNVNKWMESLRSGNNDSIFAFKHGMVGIPPIVNPKLGNLLQIALSIASFDEIQKQKIILKEGLRLFEHIFGYSSKTFIAPVYTWHKDLETTLALEGVKYIQGGKYQKSPNKKNEKITLIKHNLGERNVEGQIYLTRNVFFEPSTNVKKDWVNECMKDISAAFFWHKPAIISTHRLNYIGELDSQNRNSGNFLLLNLLKKIIKKFPDVEFLTSEQLGELIENR